MNVLFVQTVPVVCSWYKYATVRITVATEATNRSLSASWIVPQTAVILVGECLTVVWNGNLGALVHLECSWTVGTMPHVLVYTSEIHSKDTDQSQCLMSRHRQRAYGLPSWSPSQVL